MTAFASSSSARLRSLARFLRRFSSNRTAIVAILVLLLLVGLHLELNSSASTSASEDVVFLGAYTTPREALHDVIIPLFERYWFEQTGRTVSFKESYQGSGAQARAIISGYEADIALLSTEIDMLKIQDAGLIDHDWKANQFEGFVTESIVVIGVRAGNPRSIHDWEDLARQGVEVVYSNPRTSGGAMWDVLAIYGSALRKSELETGQKDYNEARELMKKIQSNVKVMDKSARESLTTFQLGVGDAVITYESELLQRKSQDSSFEIIVPPSTILIKNPVAIVDKNVEKHGNRKAVEAFLNYLWNPEAQKAFAENGFRPVDQSVLAQYKFKFPDIPLLFTTDYLGDWNTLSKKFFGPEGLWTRIVEEVQQEEHK